MRVISGKFKSRRLKGAPPEGTRPTSDKLRETLFNIVSGIVEGSSFLDGCAGTGAIGIEAISRGAAHVTFIDQSKKACRIIRENLRALEVAEGFEILQMDLAKGLDFIDAPLNIAFVDPPYDRDDVYESCLERFGGAPLLAPDGILILEHSRRKHLPDVAGPLQKTRSLVQGDAALAFYCRQT